MTIKRYTTVVLIAFALWGVSVSLLVALMLSEDPKGPPKAQSKCVVIIDPNNVTSDEWNQWISDQHATNVDYDGYANVWRADNRVIGYAKSEDSRITKEWCE